MVPNSEIIVSRTANRNNTSHYFVDGKKSNFTDVTTLLKAKGVDLNNNRFLILQVRSYHVQAAQRRLENRATAARKSCRSFASISGTPTVRT